MRSMTSKSALEQPRWVAIFAVGFVDLYPRCSRLGAIQLGRRVYRLAPERHPLAALEDMIPHPERHREIVAASRQALLDVAQGRIWHRERLRHSELAIEESLRLLRISNFLVD